MLAAARIAGTRGERRRGLLGVVVVEGVLVLPVRSVHTVGMRCVIDVAYCDGDGTVLRIETVPPGRIPRPCWSARYVVEAAEGAFAAWGVKVGSVLEVRQTGEVREREVGP